MKKIVLHIVVCCCMVFATSCGISEDCFKGNGNQVTQTFPLVNFSKIKVYDGVGLVIKEGTNYEVKVITSENILDNLEVKLEGNMLVIKDNSTCNIARDYGLTKVYVTVPDGTLLPIIPELELHCKTEQKIESEGVLHSPIIRLFSIDVSDGAGTGDFHLNICSQQLYVESNNVSNFHLIGSSDNANIAFFWGAGIFYGNNLIINNNLNFYHRGSNDMIFHPINYLEGKICSTGNVRLINYPSVINVVEYFTGRLIY